MQERERESFGRKRKRLKFSAYNQSGQSLPTRYTLLVHFLTSVYHALLLIDLQQILQRPPLRGEHFLLLFLSPFNAQIISPDQRIIIPLCGKIGEHDIRRKSQLELLLFFMEVHKPHVPLCLLRGQPLCTLFQQSYHQVSAGFAEPCLRLSGEGKFPLHDVGYGLTVVFRLKGGHSRHQFEHRHTQSPKIDPFIVSPALKHLGSAIIGRPREGQHLLFSTAVHQLLAYPEIDQLDTVVALVIEDVLGLDIPMADLMVVDKDQSLEQLVHQLLQKLNHWAKVPVRWAAGGGAGRGRAETP